MTSALSAAVVHAVEALKAERDELRDLLRTVIRDVPTNRTASATVIVPADLLAEIRRRV